MAELAGDSFRPLGSLRLAADAEEREDLRDEIEALWADGLEAEWIDAPGGPLAGRFTAAIRHPTDAALQPRALVRRLAARAADAGVGVRGGPPRGGAIRPRGARRSSSRPTAIRAACSASSRGSSCRPAGR